MIIAMLFFAVTIIVYVNIFSNVDIKNASRKEKLAVAISATVATLGAFVLFFVTMRILMICIALIILGFAIVHWKDYLKK